LKESQQSTNLEMEESADNVYCLEPPNISHLNEDYFSFHQGITSEANSYSDENEDKSTSSNHESFHSGHDAECEDTGVQNDAMSTSMQSLIDGLMAWGEGEEPSNEEGSNEADGIMDASNDHCDNLLE
jgi:hypothetical protein